MSASNVLTGGAGNDVFVYNHLLADTAITDFGSTYFTATLAGQTETPPNPSAATGAFTGVLNRGRTDFAFQVQIAGLDLAMQTQATADNASAAHFHLGPPGTAGGIVFGFLGAPNNDAADLTTVDPTTGLVTGQWVAGEGNGTTLAAQIPNLLAGGLYINFHTAPFPAGEIRGQVQAVDTGADRIDLRDAHIGDMETLGFAMKAVGGSTDISTMSNGQAANLMLQGAPITTLTAADFIFADGTPQNLAGTGGSDDLFGSTGSDTLAGGAGSDRLFGGQGADSLSGGDGNDTIYGQSGDDFVVGGTGDDSIQGNAGNDTVLGGDGNDLVLGGKGDDLILGEAGNDTLSGDLGNDTLWGGTGADRFVLRAGGGHDIVADFSIADGDKVMLSPGTTFAVDVAPDGQLRLALSTGDTIELMGVAPTSFTNDMVVFG